MKPIKFHGDHSTLVRHKNMTKEECGDLPVMIYDDSILSCWRPSFTERLSLLFFGRLWLHVMTTARTQPPMGLIAKRSYLGY